jgi:hypothetical protein
MNKNEKISYSNFCYSYENFLQECEIFREKTKYIDNFKWDLCEIKDHSLFLLNVV